MSLPHEIHSPAQSRADGRIQVLPLRLDARPAAQAPALQADPFQRAPRRRAPQSVRTGPGGGSSRRRQGHPFPCALPAKPSLWRASPAAGRDEHPVRRSFLSRERSLTNPAGSLRNLTGQRRHALSPLALELSQAPRCVRVFPHQDRVPAGKNGGFDQIQHQLTSANLLHLSCAPLASRSQQ